LNRAQPASRQWSCIRLVYVKTATSREFVNLLVDLDDRFSAERTVEVLSGVRADGFGFADVRKLDERYLSWIDLIFDGTWSSEAATGSAILLATLRERAPVGFAAYGARGLRFYWLRAWENREDVGILGPFGIAPQYREPRLEANLLRAALGTMREHGYRHALIPAVTEPLYDFFVSTTGGRIVERFSMDRYAPDLKTVVMASGKGTNFQAVLDALPQGLGLDIRALIVNRAEAYAIKRANLAEIPVYLHLWDRAGKSRERYDEELIELIEGEEPDLILMLGWMHIVSPAFFDRLPVTLNIHPAFLPHDVRAEKVTMPDGHVIPAFRGAHAIRDALRAGSPWYGATAHRVVADIDRGEIFKRAPLRLTEKDEERALEALHPTEHDVLIGAIRRILAER
jgi:phosphoribosylglycinamide formyltransferase-1